jgi:hypothetical protein
MAVMVRAVPRWVRTAQRFAAADPWHRSAPTELSVEAYIMLDRRAQEITPLMRAGAIEVFAVRSEIDGVARFLPDSLCHLWKSGKLPAESLPVLLHELEPGLVKTDYRPILSGKRGRLTMVIPAALGWQKRRRRQIDWALGRIAAAAHA